MLNFEKKISFNAILSYTDGEFKKNIVNLTQVTWNSLSPQKGMIPADLTFVALYFQL